MLKEDWRKSFRGRRPADSRWPVVVDEIPLQRGKTLMRAFGRQAEGTLRGSSSRFTIAHP